MEELKNEKKRFVDKIYIITDEMDSETLMSLDGTTLMEENITILMKLRNYMKMERQKMYL